MVQGQAAKMGSAIERAIKIANLKRRDMNKVVFEIARIKSITSRPAYNKRSERALRRKVNPN